VNYSVLFAAANGSNGLGHHRSGSARAGVVGLSVEPAWLKTFSLTPGFSRVGRVPGEKPFETVFLSVSLPATP
jgi:hypothetical protein